MISDTEDIENEKNHKDHSARMHCGDGFCRFCRLQLKERKGRHLDERRGLQKRILSFRMQEEIPAVRNSPRIQQDQRHSCKSN